MARTIVQLDKHFQSGPLAGLTVPGECVTYPTYKAAQRQTAFLERTISDRDFIREAIRDGAARSQAPA